VDEGLEETFPASDAPANTVETGVRPIVGPLTQDVTGNQREHPDRKEER
jgi:hypothetical protein